MTTTDLNSLARASSAYLRSAMHQPIRWHEWGAEAFAAAARENKPMLLDIGAVWCHWCHVMDRESYDDPEIAAIVNEHFIAMKVDRDERPDIDSRYQAAVQAVSGQGGWPLTAFLTPDGKPFYGGTYFPPSDGYGRPSFRRVLLSIANAYKEKNGDVVEQAKMVESRDCAVGVLRRPGRPRFPQRDRRDSGIGHQDVRSRAWRLRTGAEVPSSFGARSADRTPRAGRSKQDGARLM